jgi:hypothetical protein
MSRPFALAGSNTARFIGRKIADSVQTAIDRPVELKQRE